MNVIDYSNPEVIEIYRTSTLEPAEDEIFLSTSSQATKCSTSVSVLDVRRGFLLNVLSTSALTLSGKCSEPHVLISAKIV